MSVLGILLSLALLILLAYRGVSVIVLAPLTALLAIAFDGDLPLLATYTQIFMPALADFAMKFFPIFLLGAIFGKLMEVSGSARSVATGLLRMMGERGAVFSLVLSVGILTYGGVSAFVVAFAVFPLAQEIFQRAKISRRLIPASIALGAFTFSMTALPGTAQIHNLLPMNVFQTTSFAAPIAGLLAAVLMFGFGVSWLVYRSKNLPFEGGTEIAVGDDQASAEMPNFLVALLPILAVIAANIVFTLWIPHWHTEYLAEKEFGSSDPSKVLGLWAMILALSVAILLVFLLHWSRARKLLASLNQGAYSSLLPTLNTASEVGYGKVISVLAGFALIKSHLFSVAPTNPLIAQALSINVLSGITGSASGGLSIALGALGPTYLESGVAAGYSPELLHRVAALACGGLDSLPHNGAVITLLTVCGLTHRESYKDIGVVSVLIPVLVTSFIVLLGSLGLLS